MVNLETGVDTSIQADTDGQNGHRQGAAAAGVGRDDQRNSRTVLTDTIGQLARERVREASRRQHPIRNPAYSDREDPHRQVRQRRQSSVLKWTSKP